MAKAAAPSKKTAKAAKAATSDKKKSRRHKRHESYNIYIHRVLKQVHPGELMRWCRVQRAVRVPSHAHRDGHLQEGHDGHELVCQ